MWTTITHESIQRAEGELTHSHFQMDLRHAEELAELAETRGRIIMVGHLLEYHPVVRRLKHMVQNGELVPVYYIYSQRVNLGRFHHLPT